MIKPATIDREAFYSQEQVKNELGISIRAIGDACRAGELKSTVRASKRFFRGQWLIDWLDGNHQSEESDSQTE